MKSLILGVLASLCSTAVLADPQPASATPPPAARTFDCGPELRASLVLRATPRAGEQGIVYNGVAVLQVNGVAADPTTLRFVNEKIAGRTIETLAETCAKDTMDLVFSTSLNGAKTDMLTVTVQGNRVMVR